jgi:hypothetical protein
MVSGQANGVIGFFRGQSAGVRRYKNNFPELYKKMPMPACGSPFGDKARQVR